MLGFARLNPADCPSLIGHSITHTQDMGWGMLSNGELLAAVEQAGFTVIP